MRRAAAEILQEYGPFPGVTKVGGVTFDGKRVWFASGDKLNALDPESGKIERSIDIAAHAGTAFDGRYLFQIAEARIQKIDPSTGKIMGSIPAPGAGGGLRAGVGRGDALGRTIPGAEDSSDRSRDGSHSAHDRLQPLRHGRIVGGRRAMAWHARRGRERAAASRSDDRKGARTAGYAVGHRCVGLESDGIDRFYCGGAKSAVVRAVRRPRRHESTG